MTESVEKLAYRIRKLGYFTLKSDNNSKYNNYVHMWRTVLDRALADYITNFDDPNIDDVEYIEEWPSLDNEDFVTVCDLCLLDAEKVLKDFERLKNGNVQSNRKTK